MRTDIYYLMHDAGRSRKKPKRSRPRIEITEAGDCLLPMRESMRAQKAARYAQLSTNPLRRILMSNVGQSWDTVHSKLRASLRNPEHYRDVMTQVPVETITVNRNGDLMFQSEWGGQFYSVDAATLYVDPDTGLLCRSKSIRSKKEANQQQKLAKSTAVASRRRSLGKLTQAHFLDGIWYEVQLCEMPTKAQRDAVIKPLEAAMASASAAYAYAVEADRLNLTAARTKYDNAWEALKRSRELPSDILSKYGGMPNNRAYNELYGQNDVYGVTKRQLSHAELKKHGLQNKV